MCQITSKRLIDNDAELFGSDAQAVCAHIGWRAEVNPIKAYSNTKGDVIANVPHGAHIIKQPSMSPEDRKEAEQEAKTAIAEMEAEDKELLEWAEKRA